MRVLVGCEYSGVVRDAFASAGHSAISCDIIETESEPVEGAAHVVGDVFDVLASTHPFDLVILHPPCTHLAVSGARWWKDKADEQKKAIDWTIALFDFACKRARMVALENPVGKLSTAWRKPDQYIQPHEHGHPCTKKQVYGCTMFLNCSPLIQFNP